MGARPLISQLNTAKLNGKLCLLHLCNKHKELYVFHLYHSCLIMLIFSSGNINQLSQIGLLVEPVHSKIISWCPDSTCMNLSAPINPACPPPTPIPLCPLFHGEKVIRIKGGGERGGPGLHGNISPNWLSEALQYKHPTSQITVSVQQIWFLCDCVGRVGT